MAFDAVQYAMSKRYTDESIEGTGGVLAGKNCQIASIEDIEVKGRKGKRVTYTWFKDGETVARTSVMDVFDGEVGEKGDAGEKGDPGEPGVSPEVTVSEQSYDTYKLHIKAGEEEYDTPNLKGMGSPGVDVNVNDENLVFNY